MMNRSLRAFAVLAALAIVVGVAEARSAHADPMVTISAAASCDDAVELIHIAPYSVELLADGSYSQVFHNATGQTFVGFFLAMDTQTGMWDSDGGDYFTYEFFTAQNGAWLMLGAAGTGIPHCTCFTVTITGGSPYDKGAFIAYPVPEPASIALFSGALLMAGAVRRRRGRRS